MKVIGNFVVWISVLVTPLVCRGGEIVLCKIFMERSEHRCVIKKGDEDPPVLKKGFRVLVYSANGKNWVATGDLLVDKGTHSIGIFKNAGARLTGGLKVRFENPDSTGSDMNWSGAFD